MKTICSIIVFLWMSLVGKAQIDLGYETKTIPSVIKEVKPYFDKIKKEDYIHLVPFRKKDKWGYMDKRTMKTVVPPFASHLSLYKGNFYLGSVYDGPSSTQYILKLDKNGVLTYQISTIEVSPLAGLPDYPTKVFSNNIEILPSQKGHKGFHYQIDSGFIILTGYSDLYKSESKKRPLLIPFFIGADVYAIAGRRTYDPYFTSYGIIDPEGNVRDGFEFKHKRIRPVTGMSDTAHKWFLVQDANDTANLYSFVNDKGEYILKNQLPERVELAYSSYDFLKEDYPFHRPKSTTLEYIEVGNSILDMYELKYINFKQQYHILSLDYATNGFEEGQTLEERRNKAIVYAWVEDGEDGFYMDFEGNEYRLK